MVRAVQRTWISTLEAFGRLTLSALGELVAPTRCAACDVPARAGVLFCPACAVSVEAAPADASGQRRAAFQYGGAIAHALTRLKYAGRADLGPRLGRAMLPAARPLAGKVDLVVPVPLHARRLAARGFNQAALLAAPLARDLGVVHAPRAVQRTRETRRQASLDRGERLANVRDGFVCEADLRGARVLLVDDVRTTGATLSACTKALRRAGVAQIFELALATRESARDG